MTVSKSMSKTPLNFTLPEILWSREILVKESAKTFSSLLSTSYGILISKSSGLDFLLISFAEFNSLVTIPFWLVPTFENVSLLKVS